MGAAEGTTLERPAPAPSTTNGGEAVRVDPDLDFIRSLTKRAGVAFKKCFQCGTCSATCPVSTVPEPFPRKEMAWAAWGMKERLLEDPDVWLCHQCNDCSTRCPRGGRPGDVLAAVRQETIIHYSFPRFFGRWVNQVRCIPLLLGIPAALLALALWLRDPIADALGIARSAEGEILYSYSWMFPHWLLNGFFLLFGLLALLVVAAGVRRFWRGLERADARSGRGPPVRPFWASLRTVIRKVFTHEEFSACTTSRIRLPSHFLVFFGFLALTAVTLWVITIRVNPLVPDDFVYPMSFLNPWKILANLGGAAVVLGCFFLINDRLRNIEEAGASAYPDWAFLLLLMIVVLSGFFTEILHYARLEPHRHVVYFLHLVFVFALLIYMPYSKFAHMAYRATAMVYAEHTGRSASAIAAGGNGKREVQHEAAEQDRVDG